jgi:hypothetical protein
MNSLSLAQEHIIFRIHKKVNLFFWVSFLLVAFINVMKQPALNIYGELIGEMGNMYFLDAKVESVWHNLTTVIAYIPLTERILSLLCVKVFGLEHIFPWFVQGCCVAMIAACASLINLSAFKKIIDDDVTRFMVGLLMGSCVYLDGMKLYNAPYIGSLFILWSIFLDKEKISLWKLILLYAGMFIFLLGKAHYIAFFPVHLFLAYQAFKQKQKRSLYFYVLVLVTQIAQLLITLSIKAKWDDNHANLGSVTISDILDYSFRYLFYNVTALGGDYLIRVGGGILVSVIALLMIWGFVKIYKKQSNQKLVFLIITCFAVSLISLAITIKGFPDYATEAKLKEHLMYHYRHFLFTDTLIICLVSAMLYGVFSREWSRMMIACLLMIMMVNKNVFPKHNPADTPSKWEIYHPLVNEEDFFIPTWTYNSWLITKNSKKLSEFSIKANLDGITLNDIKKFLKDADPADWKLRGFMLAQQSGYQKATEPITAVALGQKGQVLARATSMTPPHYKFQYFRFDDFINPTHIVLSDSKNQRRKFPAGHLMFFGQKKSEQKGEK